VAEVGASVFAALPVIETERLTLRPIRRGDEADVFAYGAEPEVSRYTTWECHRSVDDARVFVDWVLGEYEHGRPARWGIVHRDDGRLIGACGVAEWRPEHAREEIATCWPGRIR
jgi:ribosomal-protein-alanine N-acetyltransferase